MKSKLILMGLWLSLVMLFSFPLSSFAAEEKTLIGQETLFFELSSSQDRLISYLSEYYGKHHLIITFFPAAFTPI
jgi:hypothetical protein